MNYKTMNECGDGYAGDPEAQAATKDAAIRAEALSSSAKRDAEWTREVTIARRARWNATAPAMRGKPIAAIEKKAGCSLLDLRHYVAAHGL